MAKIYRLSDKIKYKIGDIEVQISPLSVHDKATLHAYLTKAQSGEVEALMKGSAHAIKLGVKAIKGLEDSAGNPYELSFEEGTNQLSDECVEELMNLSESPLMIALCSQLISGIPNALPQGVSLVEDGNVPNALKGKKQSKSSGSTLSEK